MALWIKRQLIAAKSRFRSLTGVVTFRKSFPRTDKVSAASIQWAERIMEKIDDRFSAKR